MSSEANDNLVQAAMDLRAASPRDWEVFVSALQRRSDQITQACISASTSDLQRLQGCAQEARTLVTLLYKAPELFAAMQKLNRKPNGNVDQPVWSP